MVSNYVAMQCRIWAELDTEGSIICVNWTSSGGGLHANASHDPLYLTET